MSDGILVVVERKALDGGRPQLDLYGVRVSNADDAVRAVAAQVNSIDEAIYDAGTISGKVFDFLSTADGAVVTLPWGTLTAGG